MHQQTLSLSKIMQLRHPDVTQCTSFQRMRYARVSIGRGQAVRGPVFSVEYQCWEFWRTGYVPASCVECVCVWK
jgi:hypothetical protein